MKKLIAAKPISCARKSRDGDKANCKEQGRCVISLKVGVLLLSRPVGYFADIQIADYVCF